MIRLWVVKKLLDPSWLLLDSIFAETIAGHMARLKLSLGVEPASRLDARQLAEVKFHLRNLELALEPLTHAAPAKDYSQEEPWEGL